MESSKQASNKQLQLQQHLKQPMNKGGNQRLKHVTHKHNKDLSHHEAVSLVEFMYLALTYMPGECYRRRLGSLLLCLCVTYFERQLTPLSVNSAQALWASFCFRLHLNQQYSPSSSLRSSSDTRILKLQRFNRKTHGFRTFSHFGPHILNNHPQDIRHSATLSSVKTRLKTFFFSEYFS